MNTARIAHYSQRAALAARDICLAENKFMEVIKEEYPPGSRVRVVHSRGEYEGAVVGHDLHGQRIVIKNENTGKVSSRWFREIETPDLDHMFTPAALEIPENP